MTPAVQWAPTSSGDLAATHGPYTLVAGEYRDRDGAWYAVYYGSETLIRDSAMTLENAMAMAENSVR